MIKTKVEFYSARVDCDKATRLSIQIIDDEIAWRNAIDFEDGATYQEIADTLSEFAQRIRDRDFDLMVKRGEIPV